jgi:hypothetical protein
MTRSQNTNPKSFLHFLKSHYSGRVPASTLLRLGRAIRYNLPVKTGGFSLLSLTHQNRILKERPLLRKTILQLLLKQKNTFDSINAQYYSTPV